MSRGRVYPESRRRVVTIVNTPDPVGAEQALGIDVVHSLALQGRTGVPVAGLGTSYGNKASGDLGPQQRFGRLTGAVRGIPVGLAPGQLPSGDRGAAPRTPIMTTLARAYPP